MWGEKVLGGSGRCILLLRIVGNDSLRNLCIYFLITCSCASKETDFKILITTFRSLPVVRNSSERLCRISWSVYCLMVPAGLVQVMSWSLNYISNDSCATQTVGRGHTGSSLSKWLSTTIWLSSRYKRNEEIKSSRVSKSFLHQTN